ncbi:Inducible metalloproteinase inhibitor protein [Papilio xuthus]|uniref:Inducible metalloproteinase inhibitor protein n=1 Tax=Papilio xuthus TaxID=66420 RepID=A0A194PYE5_PAPXU|nr:Inducible metalloproteinase inhibitor protein [Papilio xuthus]
MDQPIDYIYYEELISQNVVIFLVLLHWIGLRLEGTVGTNNVTCGDNEVFNDCPSLKCEFCPTSDAEARACLTDSQDVCPPAKCTCRNNYRRLHNGTCVPTRECPSFKCPGVNEQFDACPVCPSDNCTRATANGTCHFVGRIGILLQCRPSCRCKKNYWRDGDRCVPFEKCPNINKAANCTGPNESLQCVRSCPPLATCDNRNKTYHCPINKFGPCYYKCACNKGFYRNADGFCVTNNLCDKKCNDPNAEYKPDKKKCPSDLCSSIVSKFACNPNELGQPGCVCKSGFLRLNENSTCIPANQCPEMGNAPDKKCSGPNEEYKADKKSCPPEICRSIIARYKCDSKEKGQPSCACKPGFLRLNLNSSCIPMEQCPELQGSPDYNKKCTGPNEVYKPDKKKCPPQTCQSKLALYKCDAEEKGQPGCVCKPGYLRLNVNSTCIPSEQCSESPNSSPLNCSLPNESSQCIRSCPPLNTCDNRNKTYHCLVNASAPCKQQCACNKGFYRNSDGFCVTNELCDKKCSSPHEVFTTNKKECSPDICSSIVSRYACNPNITGVPGCVCESGYLRLSLNSTCIPMNQCPELANATDYDNGCSVPDSESNEDSYPVELEIDYWQFVEVSPKNQDIKDEEFDEDNTNN